MAKKGNWVIRRQDNRKDNLNIFYDFIVHIYCLFCFSGTSSCAQNLLWPLHSGITSGGAQWTIQDTGTQTKVGQMQSTCPTHCTNILVHYLFLKLRKKMQLKFSHYITITFFAVSKQKPHTCEICTLPKSYTLTDLYCPDF